MNKTYFVQIGVLAVGKWSKHGVVRVVLDQIAERILSIPVAVVLRQYVGLFWTENDERLALQAEDWDADFFVRLELA